ncbi:MAG: replication-associated recombination protein A, partial [archaeon]|nr:replication-associated recombination protein A [archaeon]
HRLNKDKQDLLLPHVEDGSIILIGATTANPYHSINPAIRSRCHLFEFKPLNNDDIKKGINNALTSSDGLDNKYTIDDDALNLICDTVNGDIRWALNILELCAIISKDNHIDTDNVKENCKNVNNRQFGSEDGHYDLLSGLQKSIRGSDPNGALYYLSLLAQSGDVDSIERRLLVIAYEDIGLANPALAARTINACKAAEAVGFPEAIIPLGVHIIDLCLSPKSRTGVDAVHKMADIVNTKAYDMPKYLRLTPVGLNKDEQYSYDRYDCFHKIQYLPDELKDVDLLPNFNNNRYEQQLKQIYDELKKNKRTSNLKDLYK